MIDRPTKVRWVIFALGGTTSWLLYVHRYAFALIKPKLAEEWGVDTVELGLLDSAFSTAYVLFQFPAGIMADLAGTHLVLTGLILIWSVGLAMHAWAPGVPALWWARGLLGAGQSGVLASVSRMTRMWFPTRVRATVQGFVGVFAGRAGGLSGYVLTGYLMIGLLGMGWRTAVYILAALGVVHALALLFLYRDSPREHPWVNESEVALIEGETKDASRSDLSEPQADLPEPKTTVRSVLRRASFRSTINLLALNVQSVLSGVADSIYSNWIPLFLFQVHALKFKEMGIYSALPLLGGALGGALGGWLNDAVLARTGNRRWSRSGVALAGKGLAAVFLVLAVLETYDDPYAFCWMLFLVKFVSDWSVSTGWATVTDIGGKATASVFAFNNTVAGISGIVAPPLYGFVAEFYDWQTVFLITSAVYALCALSWLAVDSTIPLLRVGESDPHADTDTDSRG